MSAKDYCERLSRHFKALTRKNMILWYRTPCFSALEILLPCLLMIVLACLRSLVPFTYVDQEGMLDKKLTIMPGLSYNNGIWDETNDVTITD